MMFATHTLFWHIFHGNMYRGNVRLTSSVHRTSNIAILYWADPSGYRDLSNPLPISGDRTSRAGFLGVFLLIRHTLFWVWVYLWFMV